MTTGGPLRRGLGLDRPMTWRRVARDGLLLLGILAAVTYWLYLTTGGGLPVDVRYYWAADPHNLYPHPEAGEGNGYNYSPAFEFVVGWWRGIPFEAFAAIWRGILLAMLVWLAGPFTLPVLLTVPVASEINAANIQIPLAMAIVLGFQRPWTWAFVVLTKLTPGIGLVWFLLRREWRRLAIAVAATLGIAAISFVLNPEAWFGYVRLLTGRPAPAVAPYYLPFWTRLPFAVSIIAIGACRGWRWPVVVGATLALPVYYITSSAMLVGVLPFLREALGRWLDARTAPAAAVAPGAAEPDSSTTSAATSLSVDSAR